MENMSITKQEVINQVKEIDNPHYLLLVKMYIEALISNKKG